MGLFKRKTRPEPPKTPTVFITLEESAFLYRVARTSRFFFVDALIEPGIKEELPDGFTRFNPMTFLPDRDAYMHLREQLKNVIHQNDDDELSELDLTRCYPHYIAVQWLLDMQPEDDLTAAAERIEREVVDILAEYFDWEKPVLTGRFNNSRERLEMSQKLGVSWSAGSYN